MLKASLADAHFQPMVKREEGEDPLFPRTKTTVWSTA